MFDIIPPYILPFLICLSRIVDVSLGTLRTVAVIRGKVPIAAILGFFEVTIWVVAVSQVMARLDNPFNILGYAAGFALGNALGITIEKKLALGRLEMRLITRDKGPEIAETLRERGLRVTEFDGRGKMGVVTLLYVILDRADAVPAQKIAEEIDPGVFVAFDDSHGVNRSLYPTVVPTTGWRALIKRK